MATINLRVDTDGIKKAREGFEALNLEVTFSGFAREAIATALRAHGIEVDLDPGEHGGPRQYDAEAARERISEAKKGQRYKKR